jgi:molybdopterin-binding protein
MIASFHLEATMLGARNQFPGTIQSVRLGNVMAEVLVTVGILEIASAITRDSAEQMNRKVGDAVTADMKSTEVLIAKGWAIEHL